METNGGTEANATPPRSAPKMFEVRGRLPRRVMALDPDAVMVSPTPMAWDPIPSHAIIPIPGTVNVIWPVTDGDIDPQRFRALRQHRSRKGERRQQNSYFVFHKSYSFNRFNARIDGIMHEIRCRAFITPEQAPRPKPALDRPIFHVRESNPAGAPPLPLPEY